MAAVPIPGSSLAVTTNQKLTPLHRASISCCSSLNTWHCTPRHLQGIIIHKPRQHQLLLHTTHTKTLPWLEGVRRSTLGRRMPTRPGSGGGRCLPGVPSQAGKEEVVEAAAAHVKVLGDTAAVLESYRELQQQAGGGGGAAAVEVTSREALCFAARPGALRRVLEPFLRRGVQVLAATITRRGEAAEVTVTVAATAPVVAESITADIAGIE